MIESSPNDPLQIATQLQTDGLNRRINQLWVVIWLTTLAIMLGTFFYRRTTGNPTTTISILLQIIINGVALANLILLNTKHARFTQGLFVFVLHLAVPPVLILFGGTRGFGDIAIFMVILVSMLYGWQRWMLITFGVMAATLIWVLYLEAIGRPITPLLDYSTRFTTFKFTITTAIMVFTIRYLNTFYNNLLDTYRAFAHEQVRLNNELTKNKFTLIELNKNLQISRQNIVTAREEERRRLRRDLHDGLGPSLAAQILRIGIARKLLVKDSKKSEDLLQDVETGMNDTLSDLRKVVYGLRPPLLDQFGLLGAITDFANQQTELIDIKFNLPAQLPPIGAAVEVAIYRIFQTALDNVIQHAQADRILIDLEVEAGSIQLKVSDNGIGIAPDQKFGVGLTSMHERAEELGGTVDIVALSPRGTELNVAIPLPLLLK